MLAKSTRYSRHANPYPPEEAPSDIVALQRYLNTGPGWTNNTKGEYGDKGAKKQAWTVPSVKIYVLFPGAFRESVLILYLLSLHNRNRVNGSKHLATGATRMQSTT